jgi:uncharacterized coiled-coil protein SlyX
VHRSLGSTNITLSLEGAPGTTIDLPASGLRSADPVGLVTRLENRLIQLETRKASAQADIEHARRQITHARSSIGQPFPHAAQLAAARDRVRQIDEALDRMAQQEPGRAVPEHPGRKPAVLTIPETIPPQRQRVRHLAVTLGTSARSPSTSVTPPRVRAAAAVWMPTAPL